jgi:hypothetical protein
MVESGHNYLVTRLPLLTDCPAGREGEAGHILTKSDFLRPASIKKIRHSAASRTGYCVGFLTGKEGATQVAIVVGQIVPHRIDYPLGCLSSARPIEEYSRLAVYLQSQRGELASKSMRIKLVSH